MPPLALAPLAWAPPPPSRPPAPTRAAAGGAPALKSIGAPLPQITFCPTGGVSPANANDYLSLPNVVCAGGSWVAPGDLVAAGDWAGIEALARDAAKLKA